jgi:simple sugar transport system permease protein
MSRLRSVPLAILVGVAATLLLLVLVGAPPFEAMRVVFDGAFGNQSRVAATLMAWIPLALAAAGLLITFQGGLWNIGVEGQIAMGAIGAAWVARTVTAPTAVMVPLTLLGGAVFGAAWALIPAWLRTRFRVHEIFSGVALSFVAGATAVYLIIGPWSRTGVASTSGTDLFDERAWLPTIGSWRVSPVGLVLAVAAVLGVLVLLRGYRFGLRLRAVGRPQSAPPRDPHRRLPDQSCAGRWRGWRERCWRPGPSQLVLVSVATGSRGPGGAAVGSAPPGSPRWRCWSPRCRWGAPSSRSASASTRRWPG